MPLSFSGRDLERLEAMLDAADRISAYIAGIDKADFFGRDMVFDAVCPNLVRSGEGGKFLSDDAKARLTVVHWPDVVAMRNRIAHDYRSLEETIIWMTVVENIPELASMIRDILRQHH